MLEAQAFKVELEGVIEWTVVICPTVNVAFASDLDEGVRVSLLGLDHVLLEVLDFLELVLVIVEEVEVIEALALDDILTPEYDGPALPGCRAHAMSGLESVHLDH
eukprot:CAMPEP_0168610472 /NCGR_PEP_ID=MMETSP0449_2-20121227/1806_1 /TAXON_ID=1082188 /ORGANISM="Strombidium rassoulzadegani, Strain ras09" /LENGTH=104 /DNA_ID=CAMNT_0008650781 /DNA_START=530 /DNA_END=844 /DNA_ORIENTATION=+